MSTRGFIPSAAYISAISSLHGPSTPEYVFEAPGRIHILQVPPPPFSPTAECPTAPKKVIFDIADKWRQGIRIVEAGMRAPFMHNANKICLGGQGLKTIELLLTLPGYEASRMIKVLEVGSATKAQILVAVAEAFKDFMRLAPAPERRATDSNPVIGENLTWEMLVLLDIHHFEGNLWQASIAYDSN